MEENKQITNVESRIITLRNQQVLIDRDVAELYGVETKVVNQALRNNPDKFPDGYVITLQPAEKQEVVKNFDRLKSMKFSTVEPHAFTEKGLYMLATILKSPVATQTTLAIIETFTNLRILARKLQAVNADVANGGTPPTEKEQGKILSMMNDVFADNLPVKMRKWTFGINLGVFKFSMETTMERK